MSNSTTQDTKGTSDVQDTTDKGDNKPNVELYGQFAQDVLNYASAPNKGEGSKGRIRTKIDKARTEAANAQSAAIMDDSLEPAKKLEIAQTHALVVKFATAALSDMKTTSGTSDDVDFQGRVTTRVATFLVAAYRVASGEVPASVLSDEARKEVNWDEVAQFYANFDPSDHSGIDDNLLTSYLNRTIAAQGTKAPGNDVLAHIARIVHSPANGGKWLPIAELAKIPYKSDDPTRNGLPAGNGAIGAALGRLRDGKKAGQLRSTWNLRAEKRANGAGTSVMGAVAITSDEPGFSDDGYNAADSVEADKVGVQDDAGKPVVQDNTDDADKPDNKADAPKPGASGGRRK